MGIGPLVAPHLGLPAAFGPDMNETTVKVHVIPVKATWPRPTRAPVSARKVSGNVGRLVAARNAVQLRPSSKQGCVGPASAF